MPSTVHKATFGLPGFPINLEHEKLEDAGQGHEQCVNVSIKDRRSVGSEHETLIVNKCHINNWHFTAIIGGTKIIIIIIGAPKLATPFAEAEDDTRFQQEIKQQSQSNRIRAIEYRAAVLASLFTTNANANGFINITVAHQTHRM